MARSRPHIRSPRYNTCTSTKRNLSLMTEPHINSYASRRYYFMHMPLELDDLVYRPIAPHNIDDTGLTFGLVLDLVLRHAYFEGTVTLGTLSERSKLSPPIIH